MPHLKTRGKKQGRTKSQKDRTHCPLQTNVSRREVNIRRLKPADHISWRRPYGIWHHAIVVEKDVRAQKVLLIHYAKQDTARVVKEWIYTTKERGKLYRFQYPKKTVNRNPPQKVLWRAEKCIAQKKYHLFFNNCEHFATFCKTGRSDSVQISWLSYKLNQTDDITHYVILNEVINAGSKAFIAEGVVELVSKRFSWPCTLGVSIIEVVHFVHDFHTFYSLKLTREIIGEDYYTTVIQRAVEGVLVALWLSLVFT